jgi:alanine racemase
VIEGEDHPAAWAEIDLDAIASNVRALAAIAPASRLCAVVKADAYGHGALPVARAALGAGASALAVAQVGEGVALREAGIDAPVLVLAEPPAPARRALARAGLDAVAYTPAGIEGLGDAARAEGHLVGVHLKLDTGMRRVGCEPGDAVALAAAIDRHPALRLVGVMTHLAAADEPGHPATAEQLERFGAALDALGRAGLRPPLVHAANSAALLRCPEAHFDAVRCGIALYGIPPAPGLAGLVPLRPALRLVSRVGLVKPVRAGEGVSYGHRFAPPGDTFVATVPVGYADGVRRSLGLARAPVLVGGRRRPMAGVVTMDQTLVDLGPGGGGVAPGDEVVLVGDQGEERITFDELAELAGTISYELCTALGTRVARRYVHGSRGGGGAPDLGSGGR